jgi:3-mercaptopyruvate sulfurtransferase SseA
VAVVSSARWWPPDLPSGVGVVEVDVSRAAYDEWHIDGAVLWNAYADLKDADYRLRDTTARLPRHLAGRGSAAEHCREPAGGARSSATRQRNAN